MSVPLQRFWFHIAGDVGSPLGYGVTAWTQEDAVSILQTVIFKSTPLPNYDVQADVDVSRLDAEHILPNMESPTWRGIWFPRGFAKAN
jgi:hypothetical protein